MLGLIRRNRRPTALRHLVSMLSRDIPPPLPQSGRLPSHHIFCAGTYTAVFARLAAESALAACPPAMRPDFSLYIHVDGVAAKGRQSLMDWLAEIPGVQVTYGMFGILPHDRIPGKWHQVMINDVVRRFASESHLAFIDADLFIGDDEWWNLCRARLAPDVYALTAGLRQNRHMVLNGETYFPIKTNLFTLNTSAHLALNTQGFNKDARALALLKDEFPDADLVAPNIDTLIAGSLRAQAHGLSVVNVDDDVSYCHVGGFSHLGVNKFNGFDSPENRRTVESWLGRLRVMTKVLDHFLAIGWERFVDPDYRLNIERARQFVEQTPLLRQTMHELTPTRHERVFDQLFGKQ